jgi:hypothetical protein
MYNNSVAIEEEDIVNVSEKKSSEKTYYQVTKKCGSLYSNCLFEI